MTSLLCSPVYSADSHTNDYQSLSKQRREELHNLLLQDCGSCHGMTMKGGLGPALTPDALSNKSRQMIEATILYGRPGTPMPPWNTLLTKEEVRWLVDTLYSGIAP
ncbi:c-type cytochrome [Sulfuriflexus mobilis]|uniref:c-type cytochrome n=1 Tax=Sulfuriflexus mobilis TaxID=1811807 RepID=UPI0022B29B29|nr:cytochrome c [Sulfuriflexus mobilis]